MLCRSLMVQTQLAYPTHQKYNFPQLCICSFLLFIKGFKKSFPSCEAVLDFQSTGLLGIAGEYFLLCLRNVRATQMADVRSAVLYTSSCDLRL